MPQNPEASSPLISKFLNKLEIILNVKLGFLEFPIKPAIPQIEHLLSFFWGNYVIYGEF